MSRDWDVYCIDCDKEHGFDNANHRDGEMADLCANGPKIKQLIILMRSIPSLQYRLTAAIIWHATSKERCRDDGPRRAF